MYIVLQIRQFSSASVRSSVRILIGITTSGNIGYKNPSTLDLLVVRSEGQGQLYLPSVGM